MIEDEMVGWHLRLSGHEFEQVLGDSEGQGSLVGYSPWGRKELDTTEQLSTAQISRKDITIQKNLEFLKSSLSSLF